MLSSSEKYELKKKFRHLESQICKIDTALDSKADLVDGVVPTEQLPITQDIIDALNNANAPTGINYFTTLADLSSITPGTLINVAANYSALPAANTVPGEFYWVENSQGTSWLPGPLGGTYYPNGLYYSNGTTWIFTDVPFNATQVEVDAGLNNNKFVTPQTFANAAKWDTKFDNWTVTTANTGTLTGENVLWLADTTAPRTRTLDSAGSYVHIKDTTGNALTNNITINAPVGQTINGNASETIDADFGWVEYKLVGTDWVTTEGDSGAASNQLIIDSTPTNGSTNPVSSDGVYDALQLKQDTVSLTTTGTSGAATLVGSTLNIPQYQGVLTNPVTGTGTAGQVAYFNGTSAVTGSANLFWDAVNNRLGIGTNAPTTTLDVNGTVAATTLTSPRHNVGTSGGNYLFATNDDGSTQTSNGLYNALFFGGSNTAGYGLTIAGYNTSTRTNTSGVAGILSLFHGFAPTSGTGQFRALTIGGTINQTGGANGITRGLYVNPTLTAAADWRSVEFSNNTGWGLYGAGTANNYLAGSLGIGTTTLTGYNMRMAKAITGSTTSYGVSVESTLNSDVTNAANIYLSSVSTQTAAYTLTSLRHFFATGAGIGGSSAITNQFGYSVASSMTTATNNYGFRGDIPSGTGRWNLYMNGTAANYLAGDTSIGTTTSSGRLTVRGSGTTSATNGLLVEDSGGTDTFAIRDDGGYAFKGGTVGVAQTGYTTFTNLTTDRTCDANATTVEELADILGTLIEDLKTKGIIAA